MLFLFSIVLTTGTKSAAAAQDGEQPTVVFFGDSLTAGFGVEPAESYPSLVKERIEANGWNIRVVNAGISGDTTAGGLRRIDWLMKQPISVLVLALGANDGLRGVNPNTTKQNLLGIIEKVRKRYPNVRVVVAGMLIPPNMGPDYTDRFRTVFPEVAKESNATLIPFLLEGVAAEPTLNLPDGIHPSAEGYKRVAENVWQVLEPVLRQLVENRGQHEPS